MRRNVVVCILVFLTVIFAVEQTYAAPVAYWRFDEGSGTTAADSAGSNNASLVNGPAWSADKPTTPFTNLYSISFDGVNDYVLKNGVVTTAIDNVTLAAWVKWEGPNNISSPQTILYNGNSGTSGYGMYLWSDGSIFILAGGVAIISTNITLTTDNTWHHLAAKRESGTWTIFFDGTQQTVTVNNNATPNIPSGDLIIGGNNLVSESFNGVIDDVRIYDQALSSSAIAALVTGPVNVPTMNEWGMIIFMVFSGVGSIYYLRRQRRV